MWAGLGGGFLLTLAFLPRLQSKFNRSGQSVVNVWLTHTHLDVTFAPVTSHRTPGNVANVPPLDVKGHGTGSVKSCVLSATPLGLAKLI